MSTLPLTYWNRDACSFNEGGRYFNFHFRWKQVGPWTRGFYIYLFGFRIYWFQKLADTIK